MSTTAPRPSAGPDVRWLTDAQQAFWRQWLALQARMPIALHRQLHEECGLSLQDFEVLVHLTEAPSGKLRVTELASALSWERSRVSHHVTRMGRRGLVDREECEDDGRGSLVVVTPAGHAAMERAVPTHVRTVRELVFASLDDTDLSAVAAFAAGVLARLDDADQVSLEGRAVQA